jgi:hypothetical protein
MAYGNMEGIKRKEEEILRETQGLERVPDIIAATETWEDITSTSIKTMPRYKWIGKPNKTCEEWGTPLEALHTKC